MSKDCPDMRIVTQGADEISFPEHQFTPAQVWHNIAFYMDDVFIGYFSICSDGRMELDIQDKEKKLIAKKLVPMLAPFPSMVESISADIVLKSPLEM